MGKKVKPSGDPKSPIWFIGEAPGQKEVIDGAPFVGPSGMLLRRFMLQSGIDPTESYFDNIYNERAPGDKLTYLFKNGLPNDDVQDSIKRLNESIQKYRPNLIVTLGSISTNVLAGKTSWDPKKKVFVGLHDYRGSLWEHVDIPGQKILPALHPAYILRSYQEHGILLFDLSKAKRELEFPEIRRRPREFIPAPKGLKLQEVRDRLLNKGHTITVDIEWINGKLICVGMTTDSSWGASVATESETELSMIREVLLSGKPLNMQNSAFDASILEWHHDMPVYPFVKYDTMLAAHALDPELPKDLGFLASLYTDQPNWKDMVDWDKVKKGKQAFSDVYIYNCIDAYVQHEIMDLQLKEDFPERPDKKDIFEFEMALVNPLWEMSRRGMRIDPERMNALKSSLELEIEMESHIISVLNGGQPVNVKSGPEVGNMLFDYLGLKPGSKTKTGRNKLDDKVLSAMLGRCKTETQKSAIKYIRRVRQKRDILSKFVDVELDADGRTRGIYNPGGTTTGRLASKKFYPTGRGHQQQNITRSVRTVIVPDKGLVFASYDKERAESLVVAHLTNDPIMLDHHKTGADAHRLLAQLFYECEPEEVTKDQRYLFKKTRHAGNYMEGHITFMRDVNQTSHITGVSITSKEAEEFITWYRSVHTELKPWWLRVRDQLYKNREIINLMGRPRTFYDRTDSILPEAVAYNPQGTVGDLVNMALLNVSGVVTERTKKIFPEWEQVPEWGAELKSLGVQLLNQVHDSIGFQFPPKNETRVREIFVSCLKIPLVNPHTRETFYIGDDFKVGDSWGEAS